MPFSESLKTQVRKKAHLACCLCKSLGVEYTTSSRSQRVVPTRKRMPHHFVLPAMRFMEQILKKGSSFAKHAIYGMKSVKANWHLTEGRTSMRKNITISLVLMLCVVAVASCIGGKSPSVSEDDIPISPPDLLYKDSEIIWFGTTGNTVVACWPDGTVCRWDLDTGKRISHFRINNYDFSLDDNLYLFSSNKFLVAYNNNSLCLSHTSRPLIAVYNLAFGEGWNMFNKEQEKLYYDYVNAIYFYDLATGEQIKKIKFEDVVLDILGFSKDGRLFFVRTDEPLVYCFDLQTGKSIWCGHYPECDVLGTTHIRGDGMGYVAFFFSKISARDKSDKLLWQKEQIWQRDPNNIWRIQIADGQPLGPTDVVLLEEELSD